MCERDRQTETEKEVEREKKRERHQISFPMFLHLSFLRWVFSLNLGFPNLVRLSGQQAIVTLLALPPQCRD